MIECVLLLGGNVGDVEQTFLAARADLEREVGTIRLCSSTIESEAWGFDSAPFLNQAVILETESTAEELLDTIQRIEERWGRERDKEREAKAQSGEIYLARTLDIDIIFYGDKVIHSDRLIVPHPLMGERKFVLEPIVKIAPHLVHPKNRKSVEQMLNELNN